MTPLAQLAVNAQSGMPLPPRWGWWVILYFFLGGLAAGSYFIATMLTAVGDRRDRDAVRLGYTLAFPLVLVCGLLLIIDLGKPLRFWHMLIQSNHVPAPMFKPWSPISVGSWGLAIFGLFALISFIGAQVEGGRIQNPTLVRLDRWARARPRPVTLLWEVLGAFFGFFLAGYTGVLMTSSTLPVWHNARLLGALFLLSAASTSYALLLLLLTRRGRSWTDATIAKLARADRWAIVMELVVIAAMIVLLGGLARPIISGGFGVVFWLGVVALGLIAPLVLHWREGSDSAAAQRRAVLAARFVLIGGFLLRFVIVSAPQWPRVSLWHL
ncbi:MAG: polysulfide reductase NrfD [Gemmatimonadota bacterium]|nr:polysulfide reductase NrfD [Gemmatimonadota bacterium]